MAISSSCPLEDHKFTVQHDPSLHSSLVSGEGAGLGETTKQIQARKTYQPDDSKVFQRKVSNDDSYYFIG